MMTFLMGALLSIPLSVLANLWTPKVKDYLARRSSVNGEKRVETLSVELRDMRTYRSDKPFFAILLMRRILSILLGMLTLMLSIVAVIVYQATPFSSVGPFGALIAFLPALLSVIVAVLTLQTIVNTIRLAARFLDFEEYEEFMSRRFAKLGALMPAESGDPGSETPGMPESD